MSAPSPDSTRTRRSEVRAYEGTPEDYQAARRTLVSPTLRCLPPGRAGVFFRLLPLGLILLGGAFRLGGVEHLGSSLTTVGLSLLTLVLCSYAMAGLERLYLLRTTIGTWPPNWPVWILQEMEFSHLARWYLACSLRHQSESAREVTQALTENFEGSLQELLQTGQRLA